MVALTLLSLLLIAPAGYALIWLFLQILPPNILTMTLGLLPMFAVHYAAGPDYFSWRVQIGFFLVGASIVLAATALAVFYGNTQWPVIIHLVVAGALVIAAFARRALYGPDPDLDGWWS